jgi:hypothetical protein
MRAVALAGLGDVEVAVAVEVAERDALAEEDVVGAGARQRARMGGVEAAGATEEDADRARPAVSSYFTASSGAPTTRSAYPSRFRSPAASAAPNWAPGRPPGPVRTWAPVAVGPLGEPRRIVTAPRGGGEKLSGVPSSGVPTPRSAKPSPSKSPPATAWPKWSWCSEASGTPSVVWSITVGVPLNRPSPNTATAPTSALPASVQ